VCLIYLKSITNRYLVYLNMNYQEYIEIRADKRFGKPCIKGTRISVYDVLNWLSNGMSKEEILEDFEELDEQMINACLAFAADKEHKLQIIS
jgi:uncharacterized protein (DUF433 family)